VSSREVQRVAERDRLDIVEESAPSGAGNQELDIVEGSATSEMEEEPTRSFSIRRAGNVGHLGRYAPPRNQKKGGCY
jgi:hypothetical protein